MATIHPVVDEGLGNSTYLVELGEGRALVVDPARDPTPYLELARWRRLRIAYAAETHLHADFLTGSRELAAADGAQVLAPQASRLGLPPPGAGGWRGGRPGWAHPSRSGHPRPRP